MSMYYVFDEITFDTSKAAGRFHNLSMAIKEAEDLKAKTGKEHHIIKVEMIWTTKFLQPTD